MDLLHNNSNGRFQEETPTQLLKQQIKSNEYWNHYFVQLLFFYFYWQEAHKKRGNEYLSTTPSIIKSNAKPAGAAEQ